MTSERNRSIALIADSLSAGKDDVRKALDRIGLDMLCVENGHDALSAVLARRPAVVITSLDLDGIDGITLTNTIRSLPHGKIVPIVIVADLETISDEAIDRAYRCGVNDIIQQPHNWTLFAHKIAHLLHTKQLEEELSQTHDYMRKAIDMFPGSFSIYNPEGQLVVANSQMRERIPNLCLGMTVPEAWEAAFSTGLMDTKGLPKDEWIQQQMEAMASNRWWEITFRDGRHIRYFSKSFEDGTMFTLSLDVTDERRMQNKLIASRQEAEDSNRIKAQFLAGMSHEIRTPLNAIIGFSDIIGNELMGEIANRSYVEYARDINRSGQHLLEVLTLILDISKIETGRNVLIEAEFGLSQLIKNATRKFEQCAEEKGISLDVNADQDLAILGDETRLARAFHCVVDNAIKFTPGEGRVRMGSSVSQDSVELWVRDEGIGMAQEDLPHAFSIFSQLDEAPDRRFSGMGIGLAYAKTIVESHGGKVIMDTRVNEGTHVTFRLPIARLCAAQHTLVPRSGKMTA